jgi:hypothetical protein
MVLDGVLKLVETVTLYASTNPVVPLWFLDRFVVLVACLFKLHMLYFMHYETMCLRPTLIIIYNITS